MSEEKLSEFIRELSNCAEAVPDELIKKYVDQGVSEKEIAAALLARAALAGPKVPDSAMEKSQRRIKELAQKPAARPPGGASNTGLGARVRQAATRLLRKEKKEK